MSHIPSQVMPHAGPQVREELESPGRFARAAELVRDHPRAAAAAGAAVAAGLIAAAAIPVVRARGRASAS